MKDFGENKINKKVKSHKNIFLTAVKLFSGIAIFLVFIFSVVCGYSNRTNKYTTLKYIVIKGNNILSSSTIKDLIVSNTSTKLSSYRLPNIYYKLISNPWIKKAKIAAIFPDTVYVFIEEKKPGAFVYYKKLLFVIDANGNLIGKYKPSWKLPKNLPKFLLKADLLKDKALLKQTLSSYEKLDKIGKINYIEIESDSYQLVHFSNGLNVVINSFDCPQIAFKRLAYKWSYLRSLKNRLDSISICFDNKFVLKWKKGVKK